MSNLKSLNINGVSLLDYIYPIGAIFITSDDSFNPSNKWGGTWSKVKGKVLVGTDESNQLFSSSGKTGGEINHVLTSNEIPNHNHSLYGHSFTWGDQSCSVYAENAIATAGRCPSNNLCTKQNYWNATANAGGGNSHNNMPPYETTNIWKRVS